MATLTAPAPAWTARRGRGLALIVLSSLTFGCSGVLAKPAMTAGLSPLQVASLRIVVSAVLLLAGVAAVRPGLLRVRRADWGPLLGYGLLGVAGLQFCFFFASQRLPVGIAILLEYLSPVLVALWTRFARQVRLPGRMWAGMALALFGLAMVAQVWQGLRLDALGLLAGLCAALCSAAYFLVGERAVASVHPLGMVTWGMVAGAVVAVAVAPPWTVPAAVLTEPVPFGPWRPPVWLLVLVLVLLSTVLAYLTGSAALRHLPSSLASVLGLIEPLVTAVAAWLLLGELLSWAQWLGAAVLLGGGLVVQLASSAIAPLAAAEPLPVSGPGAPAE